MSENDPTDDELEREARNDVPLAYGGTRRHAPKLSNEPRGIDLQAMRPIMQAEREAAEMRGFGAADAAGSRLVANHGALAAQGALQGAGQNVSLLAARLHQTRDERMYASESRQRPASKADDAQAWDRYVTAALPMVQSETDACAVADALLAERRRRFG